MWCFVTKLYVFFAVLMMVTIGLLRHHFTIITIEQRNKYIALYIALLITWFLILAWLCSTCHEVIALIFLFVPFIVCFIFSLVIFYILYRINYQSM